MSHVMCHVLRVTYHMSCVTCHMSHVTCHMSLSEVTSPPTCHFTYVTCHISHVMCHMSHVTCHMSCVRSNIFFKWWSYLAEGLLSTGPTRTSFFNQPLLVMRSLGEQLITTLKVVMGLCYKTLKQIQKLPVFCRVKKFQRAHFSTKYLKSTTRQYWIWF